MEIWRGANHSEFNCPRTASGRDDLIEESRTLCGEMTNRLFFHLISLDQARGRISFNGSAEQIVRDHVASAAGHAD